MKKILFGIALMGIASMISAKSSLTVDEQINILKEQTYALNKCSSLAIIDADNLLNSVNNNVNCTIPYMVFSESNLFDESLIDQEEQSILKAAAAVAYGTIIRNKNDRGLFVKDEDREKFYNSPYDVITTKQMPKAICAYLLVIYDKKPQYFNNEPSCKKVLEEI